MDPIVLLNELEDHYEHGAWTAGTYLTPDEKSRCGYKGCLVGMSGLIEGWNDRSAPPVEVCLSDINDNPDMFPGTHTIMGELSQDALVQEFFGKNNYDEDHLVPHGRPAEYFNDNHWKYLAESSFQDEAMEKSRKEVLELIRRTRARLEEMAETPEPVVPDEQQPDVDGEDQSEQEPVDGALALV